MRDSEEGEARPEKRVRLGTQEHDDSEDAPGFGPELPEGFGGGLNRGGETSHPEEPGEEEQPEDESEEAARPRILRDPGDPTPQEVDEHNVTHMPYRAWCRHCVAGRGKEDPHRRVKQESKEAGIPVSSVDYCFFGSEGPGGECYHLGDEGQDFSVHICTCMPAQRHRRSVGHRGVHQGN